MTSPGNTLAGTWSADEVRALAFGELVAAVASCDSYTAALEAGAGPIARGLGAAVMLGLLDPARDVVHALGINDPMPHRAHVLDTLFEAPFERRGLVGQVLESEKPLSTQLDDDYMRENWPQYGAVADEFNLRYLALAPLRTIGDVRGVLWAARAQDEPAFTDVELDFLADCALPLAMAVHAGYLQEALERTAGRRRATVEDGGPPGQERRRETLLSDRERDVLRLLAGGHTNRETADELHLSVRTVEWHRARIQWKLGVSGRADLTRIAREQGVA